MKNKLIFVVWLLNLQIPALAQVAAKVVSLQGRAEVLRGGAAPWAPLANLQTLNNGDVIRTLAQSRAVLLLTDETQLKLNSNSTLELRDIRQTSSLITRVVKAGVAQSKESLLNLGAGEAWLRSKRKPAAVRVNTPAATAAIRGTEFNLRVDQDGESVLTTLDGLVELSNPQGAVLVASGEEAKARIGQAPTKSVLLRPRDAVQWVLYYSGSVSPADYPYLDQPEAVLRQTIARTETLRRSTQGDVENLRLLAHAQHDLHELKAAEETLQSALAISPNDSELLTDLAWIYLENNRYQDAAQILESRNLRTDRATVALAMAYYGMGEAQRFFETIRRVDPSSSGLASTQRAFSEMLYGEISEAKRILLQVPEKDPAYSLSRGLLSNILLVQNDKEEALAEARRAVLTAPNSPSAHLDLSLAQQSHFRLRDALESARQALTLDPNYLQASLQVARLLFAQGDTAQAEKIARQMLAVHADDAGLNSLLGFVFLAQAKTEESIVRFNRSIAADSTRGEPHLGLGIAAMRQGRRQDAIQSILIASTLEPEISLYQSYLGKAFYDEHRFEMAFDALDDASFLDEKDPTPHLYEGIFYNDLRRPGDAVRALTRSIELNDNRAVYRSRFLLDKDRATSNVNLAASYNQMYLSEWGNFEALKSQISDPSNSAAHIFLAQTFLNLKGRTQAAGSEQLLARLLLPVNANSFNAFNSYTTLFEQPKMNWTIEGRFGSFDERQATLIASGGTSRFAYGVLGSRLETQGFREHNDDLLSYDGIAQFKFALSPHSDLMLSYSHGQQNQGDHGGSIIGFENNESRRQFTRRNRVEIGYHRELRPESDILLLFSGQTLENLTDDPHFFPNLFNAGLQGGLRSYQTDPDLDLQAAHLHRTGPFQLRYGLDIYESRSRNRRTIPCCLPQFTTDFGEAVERQDVRFRNAYLQSDYRIHSRLLITGALHYDWANDNNFDNDPEEPSRTLSIWSPQAGVFFTPYDSTALRFAFIRSLQTHIRERLAPTNVHGFVIAQNDPRLSRNTSYNFGWDQRFLQGGFLRASAYHRNRATPVLVEGAEGFVPSTVENRFYGAGVVWNQLIGHGFSLVPGYSLDRAEEVRSRRHEHNSKLQLFYISPQRIWVSVAENYVHQTGRLNGTALRADFMTTDLNFAYEFPRKFAVISLNLINIFDRNFALLADPLALDRRIPTRQIRGTIRFNL